MIQNKFDKVHYKYFCEKCVYYSNRKSQYNRHLQTKKHNDKNDTTTNKTHKCLCGKQYKYHSGYYRHKKKMFLHYSK